MGHMNPGGGTLVLACCLLTVATSCAAKVNRERCAARGFGETLTCGTCDRLRDALGEQGETRLVTPSLTTWLSGMPRSEAHLSKCLYLAALVTM